MEKINYLNIPTFVEAGESSAAKSHTVAKLVASDFTPGMEQLTGNGMTTPCQTEVIINPDFKSATIEITRIASDEIRTKVLKNIQFALVGECKNVVASLPTNNDEALERFVLNAVEKRQQFTDETFRIHRLLIEKKDEYQEILAAIFKNVLTRAAETSFRNNCNEASKVSKNASTNLIEMLVIQVLDDESCRDLVERLVKLIDTEIDRILIETGFVGNTLNELDSVRFTSALQVLSNSEKKELEGVASVACGIGFLRLIVPGSGIDIGDEKNCAFRIIDVVGFNNDGLDQVDKRLRQATLTQYSYDGIIYFASKKAINKTHESYLSTIFNTMRPAKLIILSTFMDQDAIYDEDEYPSEEQIKQANGIRRNELLGIVRNVAVNDMHIILPEKEDVICISNKITSKKNGEAALVVYNQNQYEEIRRSLGRAVSVIRKRISIGVNRTDKYLVPSNAVNQYIGQIVNQLGTTIDNEYSKMRDSSEQIHHWTLDAVLWNMLSAYQHISDAKVWKNVHITTFSDMENICLSNMGVFKFSSDTKVGKHEDILRIKKEFEANLSTELYYVVRRLVLTDSDSDEKESKFKEKIRCLARQSKYNKWKIIDELRLCLMEAVTQKEYLQKMLDKAIEEALITTYDKILY